MTEKETILGFKKSKATQDNYQQFFDAPTWVVMKEDCAPAVFEKEHNNKVEDMRNTIEILREQRTVLEQQLAEKDQQIENYAAAISRMSSQCERLKKQLDSTNEHANKELAEKDTELHIKSLCIEALKEELKQKEEYIKKHTDIDGDGIIFDNERLEEKLAEKDNCLRKATDKLCQTANTIVEKDKQLEQLKDYSFKTQSALKEILKAKDQQIALLQAELRLWKPKPATPKERRSKSYKIAKKGIEAMLKEELKKEKKKQ